MQTGIYKRGSFPDYRKFEAVNYSTLKELARSPLHYRHRLDHPKRPTASMSLGTAAHTAILEPAEFMRCYAMFDGKVRRGKAWDEFQAENAGKTILKEGEFMTALAMRDAVMREPAAASLLRFGDHELSMLWNDAETGELCKGRVDFVTRDHTIIDVKTTRDAAEFSFARDFAKLQYHVQAAFYLDGYETIVQKPARSIVIAVESAAPHDVVVYELDDETIGAGRDAYRDMLKRLQECREKNVWPGFGAGAPRVLRLPKWALLDDDDVTGIGLEW